jgi:hypothetical protein
VNVTTGSTDPQKAYAWALTNPNVASILADLSNLPPAK